MYGDRGFKQRSFAPVKVGDELDVKIEAVGAKGDGIAKIEGFVLFIPGVKEGQDVRVRVTKVLRKVGFAEVVGEAQAAPEAEEQPSEEEQQPSEEPAEEPAAEEEPAEPAEDTEDFGEDLEQKKE
ncbi:TRAM domain-containing protein [Candidatus Woesearchaeota archaeon]|nr:TRAM domain-containing protein [Candidatus Woesearchaeota archaeon]